MTAACDEEFKSVVSLLGSSFESRGVDAFCLAWIKLERQLRKIVANLIFQASDIQRGNEKELREILLGNRGLSHTTFIGAIAILTPTNPKKLIGDRYAILSRSLANSYDIRQKIFHGQQTGQDLSRESLERHTKDIQEWCKLLANACDAHFGYDGFKGRTSLFKTNIEPLIKQIDLALADMGWQVFATNFQPGKVKPRPRRQ